jgi:hypothetical protein
MVRRRPEVVAAVWLGDSALQLFLQKGQFLLALFAIKFGEFESVLKTFVLLT